MMIIDKNYSNGQKVNAYVGNRLIYYFKNGKIKAEGTFKNDLMEGEWRFYRESGVLWQVGHFENDQKNGTWIRYDRSGQVEYNETFKDDKILKKP